MVGEEGWLQEFKTLPGDAAKYPYNNLINIFSIVSKTYLPRRKFAQS